MDDQDDETKELEVIDQEPTYLEPIEAEVMPPINEPTMIEGEAPEAPKELAAGDKVKWTTSLGKHNSGKIIAINSEDKHAMVAIDAPHRDEKPVIYHDLKLLRRA